MKSSASVRISTSPASPETLRLQKDAPRSMVTTEKPGSTATMRHPPLHPGWIPLPRPQAAAFVRLME
ncbi:hypothetical protein DIZ27_03095 [Streptomyces sp. NWU339]|nr:hypothetical protein DIZ27_03095 [Streptomyces sp. NWU339]